MKSAESRASVPATERSANHLIEIFLICFASLLVEISYTRIISFKLFYYYTYLVIGLALLGIGAGGVFTAVSSRLKRTSTDTTLMLGCALAAVSLVVSYVIIAVIPVASLTIWEYGHAVAFKNLGAIVVICLALFASFVGIGVMISTLFSRRTDGISKLYFADLVGAALACAVVVSLISSIGPPRTIALAAAVLMGTSVLVATRLRARLLPVTAVAAVALAVCAVAPSLMPDVRVDLGKEDISQVESKSWSPIFRVDVADFGDRKLLYHDGLVGSIILRWDGDIASLGNDTYKFDHDLRSLPYVVQKPEPSNVMIIGAAGGHEVLASLYFKAKHIDAVELNPLTYGLVTGDYADYGGHMATQPGVNYVNGDGRSFLAQQDKKYDLVWFPAPDSYAASNAASAGAFVLSESYLYTSETIRDSLDHLTDDGVIATQYGEIDFDRKPNRTTRYVSTARDALEKAGVTDPDRHILVATTPSGDTASVSTVLVKKTPFTDADIAAFVNRRDAIPGYKVRYAPGVPTDNSVTSVATLPADQLKAYLGRYPYEVDRITDDGPFFWHFARFGTVVSQFGQPIDRGDTEDALGERVLILLLVLATVLAAIFLLLPFVAMRRTWTELPRKSTSALYFLALGLGFMFFEVTLIQRLVLFLGYPTYSLTVTLASLLLFTGVGALLSGRLGDRVDQLLKLLAPAVIVMGLAYLWLLPRLAESLITAPLGLRVLVAFLVLAPLGLFLGQFMPLGLRAVSAMGVHSSEYVAWSWAVNGFGSVIGSVLATILAMVAGFNVVLILSMGIYLVALVALHRLRRPLGTTPTPGAPEGTGTPDHRATEGPDLETATIAAV